VTEATRRLTFLDHFAFWANAGLGGTILAFCIYVILDLVLSPGPTTVAAGEGRAWSLIGLTLFVPLGVGFGLTAFLVRRQSRWWWIAQVLTLAFPFAYMFLITYVLQ
jgi:hypothetical protein